MRKSFRHFAVGAAVALAAMVGTVQPASAALLLPGSTVIPTLLPGPIVGTFLDSVEHTFSTPDYSAEVRAAVYLNASGAIDFYYQVEHTGVFDGDTLSRLTGSRFANGQTYSTSVFQLGPLDPDGAGLFTSGTVLALTADRSLNGRVVGFNFQLDRASTTFTFLIRTNAPDYEAGQIGLTNGTTKNLDGFQPAGAPVPEPGSMMLLGTGLFGLAGAARRRLRRT